MYKLIFSLICVFLLSSCFNTNNDNSQTKTDISTNQKALIAEGWSPNVNFNSQDLSINYGIKPIIGIQDNYFDIKVGSGVDIAVKIINLSTNKCIRYIYVKEDSEFTVSQIPQGKYYLLIAYGENWMSMKNDKKLIGKFADGILYEKSIDIFDFGKKNSSDFINYKLFINVIQDQYTTNFNTVSISESDFLNIN